MCKVNFNGLHCPSHDICLKGRKWHHRGDLLLPSTSEYSLAIQPEQVSVEEEVVLKLRKITNYPLYQHGTNEDEGENLKGPWQRHCCLPHSKKKAKEKMKKETLVYQVHQPVSLKGATKVREEYSLAVEICPLQCWTPPPQKEYDKDFF